MDNETKKLTRQDLYEKYQDAILGIYEAGGKVDDTSVCFDKLVYMYRKHAGIPVAEDDVYEGIPEDFDYDAFGEDFGQL